MNSCPPSRKLPRVVPSTYNISCRVTHTKSTAFSHFSFSRESKTKGVLSVSFSKDGIQVITENISLSINELDAVKRLITSSEMTHWATGYQTFNDEIEVGEVGEWILYINLFLRGQRWSHSDNRIISQNQPWCTHTRCNYGSDSNLEEFRNQHLNHMKNTQKQCNSIKSQKQCNSMKSGNNPTKKSFFGSKDNTQDIGEQDIYCTPNYIRSKEKLLHTLKNLNHLVEILLNGRIQQKDLALPVFIESTNTGKIFPPRKNTFENRYTTKETKIHKINHKYSTSKFFPRKDQKSKKNGIHRKKENRIHTKKTWLSPFTKRKMCRENDKSPQKQLKDNSITNTKKHEILANDLIVEGSQSVLSRNSDRYTESHARESLLDDLDTKISSKEQNYERSVVSPINGWLNENNVINSEHESRAFETIEVGIYKYNNS